MVTVVALALTSVFAHPNPEHAIAELTQRMARSGPVAELLVERAGHYRSLRKFDLALVDLEHSLDLSDDSFATEMELCRIHLSRGQADEALRRVEMLLSDLEGERRIAQVEFLKATILISKGLLSDALNLCDGALKVLPAEVNWYLTRSLLQMRLGHHEKRLADLDIGFTSTKSYVLYTEIIEAKIDAGQTEEALVEINQQLKKCRLKSSWLLRRARARLSLGQASRAADDLAATIEEINSRLSLEQPDAALLADRALAYHLAGREVESSSDLKRARELGVTDCVLTRLLNLRNK